MNDLISFNLSYGDVRKIVHNYYLEKGRNISLTISNEIDTDRFVGSVITTMALVENINVSGVKVSAKHAFSISDLKEIIKPALLLENKELERLFDNAHVSTTIKGHGLGEYEDQTIVGKSFTVVARVLNRVSEETKTRGAKKL